jgi:hypothetical protein
MNIGLQKWLERIIIEKSDSWVIDCTGSDEINSGDKTPVLKVGGDRLTDEIYLQIPEAMLLNGTRSIKVVGSGWWLDDKLQFERIFICDHIACHSPNPLTGSIDAKSGKAFIDMRAAYEVLADPGCSVVMWHSFGESLPPEEYAIARKAGCAVASHVIAPWTVGAAKAGLKVTAEIICFKN